MAGVHTSMGRAGAGSAADGAISAEEIQGRIWDTLSGAAVGLLGPPNVVMQLARLPVGHGVARSKVYSGRADLHPFKRARTTFSYLTVALLGTDAERRAYRAEVNRAHKQVRSGPDDPVAYNAFDKDLQLWVAACLYVGAEQAVDLFYPEFLGEDDELREAYYRHCSRLATTLQVTEEMWPADRAAFYGYWDENVARIEMDDLTREYLLNLISLADLPFPVPGPVGAHHRFMTIGFLPEPFRRELGVDWSPGQAKRHARIAGAIARATRLTPGPIRRFPLNAFHRDTQRRIRRGVRIV